MTGDRAHGGSPQAPPVDLDELVFPRIAARAPLWPRSPPVALRAPRHRPLSRETGRRGAYKGCARGERPFRLGAWTRWWVQGPRALSRIPRASPPSRPCTPRGPAPAAPGTSRMPCGAHVGTRARRCAGRPGGPLRCRAGRGVQVARAAVGTFGAPFSRNGRRLFSGELHVVMAFFLGFKLLLG